MFYYNYNNKYININMNEYIIELRFFIKKCKNRNKNSF
jgi:hypothetical protein